MSHPPRSDADRIRASPVNGDVEGAVTSASSVRVVIMPCCQFTHVRSPSFVQRVVEEEYSDDGQLLSGGGESQMARVCGILRAIRLLAFSVFLIFAVTLAVFPSGTRCLSPGLLTKLWLSVLVLSQFMSGLG